MAWPYIPLEFQELAPSNLLNECLQWGGVNTLLKDALISQDILCDVRPLLGQTEGNWHSLTPCHPAGYSSRYSVSFFILYNNPSELGFIEPTHHIRKPRFGEPMKCALRSGGSRIKTHIFLQGLCSFDYIWSLYASHRWDRPIRWVIFAF